MLVGVADLLDDGAPNSVGVEGCGIAPVFVQQRTKFVFKFRFGWAIRGRAVEVASVGGVLC